MTSFSELCLLQVRIRSEHAVGYLKGRFQSLKGLRQQIINTRAHERALVWVRTCLTLHNMVHSIESGLPHDTVWDEELIAEGLQGEGAEIEQGGQLPPAPLGRESQGQRKRRYIQKWLYDSGVASVHEAESRNLRQY